MKRQGELYEKVCRFENILDAYMKARKGKRYKPEILEFTNRLEDNLIDIQSQLKEHSYKPGPYHKFKVYEPKERQIMALPFPDRVVQHALNNIIEPIFETSWIYHSYACRAGKGMHKASTALTHWLYDLHRIHGDGVYCLKADIAKYFRTIDHAALRGIVRKKIKCPDTLWLLDLLIAHSGEDAADSGIPVGNLISQLFANTYLGEMDKYIKEGLRVHHYMRYMDDFIILSGDKMYLRGVLADIERFLTRELRLELNPKTCIFKAKQGIDYVGYRQWHTHKLIRKSSIKRVTRRIKKFKERYAQGEIDIKAADRSIQSWLGHISHADTYGIRNKILSGIVLRRNPQQ